LSVEIWVASIAGGTALASSIGTLIVKEYLSTKAKERQESFRRVMPDIHRVYDHLSEVVHSCGAIRTLVMYVENGGGVIDVTSDLFATVSYEIHSGTESIKEKYQRRPIDHEYIRMLRHLMDSNGQWLYVRTEQMPDGVLKRDLQKNGTKQALVFYLTGTDRKTHYCSFNFGQDEPLSKQTVEKCLIEAKSIRDIFMRPKNKS
jgi:energy-converting hydrogenase A subunit M